MNVSELLDLTIWISREIVEKQIPSKYQTLHSILQQNSQPNHQKQPFDSQKEDLLGDLNSVPLSSLTRDQLEFLTNLGIAQAIGSEGVENLEDILYRNAIDVATAANKVQDIIASLNEGINKSHQIREGLYNCVSEEDYETEDEILMRITFTGSAKMANIKDFKSWGNIWYDIGRGIAMAHNASPEDIKIVGATKGSIIIELAVAASIAATASSIILSALKVAEKVVDIRIKAQELRGLKMRNDKFAQELEDEAENEKSEGICEITASLSDELGITEGQGDKVKALDTSVKNLVNFVEKGGIVDFIMPDDGDEPENSEKHNSDLRVAFQEIRRLEKKIALLEKKA